MSLRGVELRQKSGLNAPFLSDVAPQRRLKTTFAVTIGDGKGVFL